MTAAPRIHLLFALLGLTVASLRADPPPPDASAPAVPSASKAAETPAAPAPRGGRVGWARLMSDDPAWSRHSNSDSALSDYIKTRTSLNFDPVWHTVDASRPERLSRYPLIFSTGLGTFHDDTRQASLREYLARGGFLLIDACINHTITPSPDVFLAENTAVLGRIVPGCTVKPFPPEHPIYSCFFNLGDKPPHTYHDAVFDPRWARHPLYGVFTADDRLCAVLSLSGLQCGWDNMPGPRGHTEQCMQMVVNIYVYAMTR